MTHETNKQGGIVRVTLDATEMAYVASRLELLSRMCERHKQIPGGAVEQEGREALAFAKQLRTVSKVGSESVGRLTLLRRFAEVCRDEKCDRFTDYEAVVRQHRRLARIALNGGPLK